MTAPRLTGLFTDPRHLRGDMVLVETAIRRGWSVPPETAREIVRRVSAMVADEDFPTRVRLRAARLLVVMDEASRR